MLALPWVLRVVSSCVFDSPGVSVDRDTVRIDLVLRLKPKRKIRHGADHLLSASDSRIFPFPTGRNTNCGYRCARGCSRQDGHVLAHVLLPRGAGRVRRREADEEPQHAPCRVVEASV